MVLLNIRKIFKSGIKLTIFPLFAIRKRTLCEIWYLLLFKVMNYAGIFIVIFIDIKDIFFKSLRSLFRPVEQQKQIEKHICNKPENRKVSIFIKMLQQIPLFPASSCDPFVSFEIYSSDRIVREYRPSHSPPVYRVSPI